MSDKIDSLSVEQKFARGIISLRTLRPFVSSLYEILKKLESSHINTMGVTHNELLYNYKFCESILVSEFLGVTIHELYHIALQHVIRIGDRDPHLWNIAADLYVNKMIDDDFGVRPGSQEKNLTNKCTLKMPAGGLWCSSIDLEVDFTEAIYESLEKQAKKNGYLDYKKSQVLSGNGGQPQNNHNDQDNDQNNSDGEDGQGDLNNQQTSGNQSSSKDNNLITSKTFKFEYTGSGGKHSNDKDKKFEMDLDINKLNMDLIKSDKSQQEKLSESQRILQEALIRSKMNRQPGTSPGNLETAVEKLLESKIDWRKILRKYLIEYVSSDSSFSRPDRRFYYQRAIHPGKSIDVSNFIKGVKVCIDTSGSISDEDIAHFIGQVYQLVNEYKVEAELIYWDTIIQSQGDFRDFNEVKRVPITGRGGTDPTCCFDYFDDRKRCRVAPIVTLIFSDMYINESLSERQKKKYKDTIWICTKNGDHSFSPPMGKTCEADWRS